MIFGEGLGLNFGYCWSLDIDGVEYELMRKDRGNRTCMVVGISAEFTKALRLCSYAHVISQERIIFMYR